MKMEKYLLDQEVFEVLLIDEEVLFTLPDIVIILFNDICGDESHLDECLDTVLEKIPINLFAITILGNLIQ
jgi:hypothetical protein